MEVRATEKKLKGLRRSCGLTQKDVADAIGVSQVTVCQWENGDNMPRADKLAAIAKLYGCTIDELFRKVD